MRRLCKTSHGQRWLTSRQKGDNWQWDSSITPRAPNCHAWDQDIIIGTPWLFLVQMKVPQHSIQNSKTSGKGTTVSQIQQVIHSLGNDLFRPYYVPRAIPELSIQSSGQRACPLESYIVLGGDRQHSKPLSTRAGSEMRYEERKK